MEGLPALGISAAFPITGVLEELTDDDLVSFLLASFLKDDKRPRKFFGLAPVPSMHATVSDDLVAPLLPLPNSVVSDASVVRELDFSHLKAAASDISFLPGGAGFLALKTEANVHRRLFISGWVSFFDFRPFSCSFCASRRSRMASSRELAVRFSEETLLTSEVSLWLENDDAGELDRPRSPE